MTQNNDPENKSKESQGVSQKDLMNLIEQIQTNVKQVKELGIKVAFARPEKITLELPWQEKIVGNIATGVIHGGAISTLLDQACGMSVFCRLFSDFSTASTLDLRIDHMKMPEPQKSVMATAECFKVTENVMFSRATAWQEDESNIISSCSGTFIRFKDKSSYSKMLAGNKEGNHNA